MKRSLLFLLLVALVAAPAAAEDLSSFKEIHGASGFWRLAEDQNNVWWFVSPNDQKEFLNTVTTVQPVEEAFTQKASRFISSDFNGHTSDADLDRWATATLNRVREAGFKGLGAWCNPAFHRQDVPMSQDLNIWGWLSEGQFRFYNSDWQARAEEAVRVQVEPLEHNRNLTGYFLDNELDWTDATVGPGAYFDNMAPGDPNRQEVLKTIHDLWPTISDFNLAWETHLAAYNELETIRTLPREPTSAYSRLGSAWLSHLASDYFRITTTLVHRYDRNHLILGVRYKDFAPEEVVAASKDYTDAQSLNYYVADAKLDQPMFRMIHQLSGQPILISEYSFHALDGQSGDRDTVGFAGQVPDQAARAEGYRDMTTRLARVPYIVGGDWFQWCDEPPAGRQGDGEDVNFGVVDLHDHPYTQLVDAVRDTSPKLNPLHTRSNIDPQEDVWRQSYANKPVMHVPFLSQTPVLDGSLAWTTDCRLGNIRREETVGMDRCKVPAPNIFMGWTESGVYLAMEVFDAQMQTQPANGWWWTRDHVEFWFSTRPVASNQNEYDIFCHQFFFVPGTSGHPGVVGQWHRGGDALQQNLIPHPDIQKTERVLPDRYVVEMFIPAKALNGYDPDHQPALAFNVHVREFASAADFFWSAPKTEQTQLRPSTWGTLYLDAPTNDANTASAHVRAIDPSDEP